MSKLLSNQHLLDKILDSKFIEFENQLLELITQIIIENNISKQEPHTKKSRIRTSTDTRFDDTYWGQLITEPDILFRDISSKNGKLFRRHFRLPFRLFEHLAQLCKFHNIFNVKRESKIPVEAKVLACLRILGRDSCADDINELSNNVIAESTMYYIFKQFVNGIVVHVFDDIVTFPQGEKLQQVLDTYGRLGLPGAVGSMDCTHVKRIGCYK